MNQKKQIWAYYWRAFLLQFLALGVCIGFHRLFIRLGPQLAAPELVYGEMTDPTVGRIVNVFAAALASVILTMLASGMEKKGKDFAAFSLAVPAGIFLWQSIGEDAWHFSVNGVHFVSLESISALPLAVLFVLFLLYCAVHRTLNWGILCAILSFAVNWLGHYVLMGVYPLVESCVELTVWCRCVGFGLGIIAILGGILCGVKISQSNRQRMLSAILTYYGVGVMVFGIMG